MEPQKLFWLFFVLECVSCVPMMGHRHHHGSRMRCPKCPPGSGVLSTCDLEGPTICALCVNGTYSSLFSSTMACLPCSRCGEGLYVAHPCMPTRDTICDSCHTYRGPHNDDYIRRCTSGDTQLAQQSTNMFAHVNTKESAPGLPGNWTEIQFKVNSTYALPPIKDTYADVTYHTGKHGASLASNYTRNIGEKSDNDDDACNTGNGCGTINSTPNRLVSQLTFVICATILSGLLLMAIFISCFIIKGNYNRHYKVVATIEDV